MHVYCKKAHIQKRIWFISPLSLKKCLDIDYLQLSLVEGFYCLKKTDNSFTGPAPKRIFLIALVHTPVHLNATSEGPPSLLRLFLGLSTLLSSCHLPVFFSIFLHLLSFSTSHTFIGGPSLVGIHQGPSLSPAMLQRHWTMGGERQPSLLMSSGHGRVCVCGRGWGVCAPLCSCFNHAYYICINMLHL